MSFLGCNSADMKRKRIYLPADLAAQLAVLGGTVEQGIEKICKNLFTPEVRVFNTSGNKETACRTNAKKGKS